MTESNPDGRERLYHWIANACPKPPLRVLELGCGKGVNASRFLERGDSYVGVDCYNRFIPCDGAVFMKCDFTKQLPKGPFDIIVDRAALAYNGDVEIAAILTTCKSILSESGIIACFDLYREGNIQVGRQFLGRPARSFDLSTLEQLFSGFQVLATAFVEDENGPAIDFIAQRYCPDYSN